MAKFGELLANFGEIYVLIRIVDGDDGPKFPETSQKIESEQQVVIYFVCLHTLSNNKTMKGSVVLRTTIYTTLNTS